MRRLTILSFIFVVALSSIAFSNGANTDWEAFSDNLVRALRSSNEGLQQSAMQMVILYGDKVDVDRAVIDVVRIFNRHENPQVRKLAMVALAKIQDSWAMYVLKRNLKFEENETVLNLNRHIVYQYYAQAGN